MLEYAWLCARHTLAVSAYASELVRNRTRPRPSTDAPRSYHAWTAHVSRSFHWHPLTITYKTAHMRWRARYVSDSSVIVSNMCVIHAWFMRDSSVISTPWPPEIIGQFLDAQARTNPICAWFVSNSYVIGCVTGGRCITKFDDREIFLDRQIFSSSKFAFLRALHKTLRIESKKQYSSRHVRQYLSRKLRVSVNEYFAFCHSQAGLLRAFCERVKSFSSIKIGLVCSTML